MNMRGLGDDSTVAFSSLTADQQAAWLLGQTAAETGSVPFSQMTADQQTAFLNQSGFNSLTPTQQTALLASLNTDTTATTWIPGVPNAALIVAAALVLFLLVDRGGK